MNKFARWPAMAAIVLVQAGAAQAGEDILYEAAPAWVVAKTVTADDAGSKPLVLVDQQVRLEDGFVSNYRDTAIRLASPEALTSAGTLTAQWMPDKGDLIVHRVELIRDGKTVDLLGEGARFEVLRREQQLEQRIVDGARTATLAVPGARVGDILRLAYTVTLKDQALGEEMEWQAPLFAEPAPIGRGSVEVSWPENSDVQWKALHGGNAIEPQNRGGFDYIEVSLPVEKPAEVPGNAPFRYQMPPLLQAGSFASWNEVSATMAPHFLDGLEIEPDSSLAEQVATIEAESSDPLARAALATQLVQDKISYLVNGMNGGNYVPQPPAETWQQRYGDCKAKSVLLLTLLKAMDIEAEPLLVRTGAGDVLPDILPLPGDFDHVIVHATIGGKDYFLDGTSAGTRLANIDGVPPFSYGLPLRATGADLMPLPARAPQSVQTAIALTIDSSAGVAVPALYDVDFALSGASGAPLRALIGQLDEDTEETFVSSMVSRVLGDTQLTSHDLTYDDATAVAHVRAKGILTTPWKRQAEVYQLDPPAQPLADIDFTADRARSSWREIPLRMNGPDHQQFELKVLLPDDGKGFTVDGTPKFEETVGGLDLRSASELSGNHYTLEQEVLAPGGELPATDVPAAKRGDAELERKLPTLRAPSDARLEWSYSGKDRQLLEPLEAAYAQLIADADETEIATALLNRAGFRQGVGDFAGAKKDLDKAIEKEASQDLYYQRARVRAELGDLEGSLADWRAGEALEAKGASYAAQIELLGLLGRADEGLALADDFADLAESPSQARQIEATAMMWAGDKQQALAVLADEAAKRPGDPAILNARCWEAGIWHMADEATLDTCTRAVEKSDWSAPALDSRAMVYYRLGRLDEARADLDAVVRGSPSLAASRYMRGIVRLAQGDQGGAEDIATALRMQPSLKRLYAAYGIQP